MNRRFEKGDDKFERLWGIPIEDLESKMPSQIRALEREAPQLLYPWIVLHHLGELPGVADPKQEVKSWVRQQPGGSERVWKCIHKSDAEILTVFARPMGMLEALHASILLLAEFRTSSTVPLELAQLAASRLDQQIDVKVQWTRCQHLPLALANLRRGGIEWGDFVSQFDLIDAWIANEHLILDKNQRRSGWDSLVNEARSWYSRKQRLKYARHLLPHRPPIRLNGTTYEILSSTYAIWQAALDYRNCLSENWYTDGVRHGNFILVAARDSCTEQPASVAIMYVNPCGGLTLGKALGLANRLLAADEIREWQAVRRLLQRLYYPKHVLLNQRLP